MDAKSCRKIIEKVLIIAKLEGIVLSRTYTCEVKELKLKVRFMNHPTRMKEGKEAVTDRGYRGKKKASGMEISIPTSGTPGQNYYQKQKARKKFCKRADIEPVIGHLKADDWMIRNYLQGTRGDAINTMKATAAYNMRYWKNKNASSPVSSFVSWQRVMVGCLENVILETENPKACQCQALAVVA